MNSDESGDEDVAKHDNDTSHSKKTKAEPKNLVFELGIFL